jgi:hypothetical protein
MFGLKIAHGKCLPSTKLNIINYLLMSGSLKFLRLLLPAGCDLMKTVQSSDTCPIQ